MQGTVSQRIPAWIKVDLPGKGHYHTLRKRFASLALNTVCEEARCPNMAQCWGGGTASFMILGDICTRGCRFCDVKSGKPLRPDPLEPQHLADAIAVMQLRYVVITSVDRDDLADQGSQHFVEVVAAIKAQLPELTVELLTPDFRGDAACITRVGKSGAEVLAHNIETVRRLSPGVRDVRSDYDVSLKVLAQYRALDPALLVKSSIMLGLGETLEEVQHTLADLRAVGVDWVTLGQYLRPTRKHLPVQRYVEPAEFVVLEKQALEMGFSLVNAGPLVRSSYRAAESGASAVIASRLSA